MNRLQLLLLSATLSCAAECALLAQNDAQVLGDAVLTPAEIADGSAITYFIRFQNLGFDTAQQVVVSDTLDPRLDAATFTMGSASHPYDMLHDPGSSVVRWYFTDIHLPTKALDGGTGSSLGFVLFTVQPKPFLAPNQVIPNSACIYFDQTDIVCTEPALVWIDANAASLEPREEEGYSIVPNPNHGQFEILPGAKLGDNATADPTSADHPVAWWVTDMSGRTIWADASTDVAMVGQRIQLEKPSPGLYLLWIKEQGRLQVEQFAVVR